MEDIVVPATCQIAGLYTIHQCKNCGYSYDDTWTEPLEHDYEATVTNTNMYRTWLHCITAVRTAAIPTRDNFVGASGP